jgi:hypothetical protein
MALKNSCDPLFYGSLKGSSKASNVVDHLFGRTKLAKVIGERPGETVKSSQGSDPLGREYRQADDSAV